MIDLATLTIVKARKALDAKEFSAVDLAQAYLAEIEKKNKELNAYLEVFGDVLEQAKIAAMNTRWDASSDAPEKQVGKIVYNFNLN